MTRELPQEPEHRDPPFRRGMTLAGFSIIAVFLLSFTAWSKMAPIESAVVAPGVVSVESGVRTVQHLEGGIVQDILVGDGDKIEPDQVLLRLQSTEPLAQLNDLQAQYFEALAAEARLSSERDRKESIEFPNYLTDKLGDRAARDAMSNQQAIFDNRRQLLVERLTILRRTEDGLKAEIGGLEGQIASSERKLSIVEEELGTVADLANRKLVPRSRVLELEREKADLTGEISSFKAKIGAAAQRVAEASLRITELAAVNATEISESLREVRARAYRLNQQIAAAQDVVQRTEIRSPIGGVVVDMNIHTIGGVVSPGQTLLTIVPRDDNLVVQAEIDPLDIDRVSQGMKATVWLTSLSRRRDSGISGVVQTISADRLTEPRTGSPYYLARIVMDRQDLEHNSVPLQAGMGAEVMILTGEQTAFEYLAAPITWSLSRAFREN